MPRLISRILLCASLLLMHRAALGADNSAPVASPARSASSNELVITKGGIELNGQRVPATLRRLVDLLAARYRDANITLIGTDNVLVHDATVRLPRPSHDGNKFIQPPLHGVLAALRAASRDAFEIEAFGANDFVLTARASGQGRAAEVFKLGFLMQPVVDPGLAMNISGVEAEIAVLNKRYGERHPRMQELTDRLAVLKELQSRAGKPSSDNERALEQIQDVVRVTLERLQPEAPPPEFKFHAGTGLLVVIGTEQAVLVTRKVIDALR